MRALGFRSNGGPEVIELIERPQPDPDPGHVVLRVAYAGVNFAEVQHRRGEFGPPKGIDGYDVPGLEVSGVVASVGSGVAGLSEGQSVAAYLPAFGGYAEYVSADVRFVAPTGALPLPVAAGVPCVYPTAYGLLLDAGGLSPGADVLIHAAAGGVGTAAVAVARTLGAKRVFGTVGTADKLASADALGYDALFLREEFGAAVAEATGGRGVDLVLDPIGGATRAQSLTALAPFGRVVAYGDLARSEDWTVDAWALWKQNRTLAGFNIGDQARRAPERIGARLRQALTALVDGALPRVDPIVVPLAEAADIHRRMEAGATNGKTVLAVAAPD